ncbi:MULTISPECIES: NADPH-dependent F420 reductase [Paraburkholderia]|uniref:NADPH-dependent F420 reductase n=1 Tax=Paraburkholderia madseniana TaxID=2599607 RepID=A0AAP5BNT6_9BURK|nr:MULTISPECIES: NADPH-dependent F420 reductase [Paraburkholderia]MCX4151589.1 NADPH-dependent F420 reductase [Paraburkholderia madseniana]MDN7154519.1 NADPH-dependent F420 reductase [Paraburkholderia sp. WS6]MDQ6413402.1 NADPH-dependent F420 reductase [Paraburkholderia madseniana]
MKIGILGAGFLGRAIATVAKNHGHEVMISNFRDPRTLISTGAALGCALGTAEEAAKFGDVVVVTVPFSNIDALPVAALDGKIVIDTCNYYPDRDGHIEALESRSTTTSQMLATALPGAKVVKAFNAILAKDLETDGKPADAPNRRALPFAGDDERAKHVVSGLLDQFGFDPVDAGALADSWRFERAKPVYCIALDRAGIVEGLAAAQRDVELPHGSWRH